MQVVREMEDMTVSYSNGVGFNSSEEFNCGTYAQVVSYLPLQQYSRLYIPQSHTSFVFDTRLL